MSEPEVRVTCHELGFNRLGLRRRLRWLAVGLFALPLSVILTMMTLRFSGDHALVEALLYVMMGAPVAGLASLFAGRQRLAGPGSLEVKGSELLVRRRSELRRIPLASLREGLVSPLEGRLELGLASGDRVSARVETVEEGRRLLEAAGLDEKRRTLELLLGETLFLTLMTWLVGPALIWPLTLSIAKIAPWPQAFNVWTFLGLFLLLLRGVHEVLGPARLTIGADGVIVHQAFRDRFLPFAQIASVTATSEAVVFHLEGGAQVRAKARHLTREQHLEVESRIARAREVWRDGAAEASALATLDRNGRSSEAWREALAGLLRRDQGYRESRVTREQLLAAVSSASASAERRLGAALALRATGDDEVKLCLRVAAEACANRKLRVALEKVAEGESDEAAIEEAIAAEGERTRSA
jgi:hypothetical protein